MSKTKKTRTKPKTKTTRKLGQPMKGCEILVAALEREGVDSIFAYPGGASMELHQALTKSSQIRTYLPRHEQGGVFAAGGYGRATIHAARGSTHATAPSRHCVCVRSTHTRRDIFPTMRIGLS